MAGLFSYGVLYGTDSVTHARWYTLFGFMYIVLLLLYTPPGSKMSASVLLPSMPVASDPLSSMTEKLLTWTTI